MRANVEGGRIAGGARWRIVNVANQARIVAKDLADARERRRLATAQPSVAERQSALLAFYERFEDHVETLCDLAQHGPTARLDEAFRRGRGPVAQGYEALRPFVAAFLPSDESDAFDRLLEPETLEGFLLADDGGMICRITNCREALSLYAEHLRQLAARKSA